MNITFKSEEEQLIQEKLKSGKYATAYEVIVEALRLLEERDKQHEKMGGRNQGKSSSWYCTA